MAEIINTTVTKKPFPFWRLIYKNLVMIILIIAVCVGIGVAIGFTQTKDSYTASSRIILKASFDYENGNDYDITTNLNNNTLAKRTLPTLAAAIKTPKLVESARSRGDDGISAGGIGVSYNDESLIFTVSYTDDDKGLASSRLADVIWAIQTELPKMDVFSGVTGMEFIETTSHVGTDDNTYPTSVSNPRSSYIALSIVAGIVLAVGAVFLKYVLDNKIKDGADLEELSGASLLAVISK